MRIDPGTAANEKSSTGRLASAPISACESARLWWIMGITGGTGEDRGAQAEPEKPEQDEGSHGRSISPRPRAKAFLESVKPK